MEFFSSLFFNESNDHNTPKTSAKDTTMLPGVLPNPSLRLLDQVRDRIRVLHYSMRTEATYPKWIKRFILISVKATQNG